MSETKPYVIVVGLDVAGDSPGTLSYALELARSHRQSEIHVLGVVRAIEGIQVPSALDVTEDTVKDWLDRLKAFTQVQLDEAVARGPFADGRPPRVQIHAAIGSPVNEIVWLAAHFDADLVVVGTHSRRGLRRLLLGSVAERVTRLAGCPVVVVRDKQHDAPWRVPEIEPLCPECADVRAKSEGRELWCSFHAGHHFRAHVVSRQPHETGPSPVESATGV